MRWLSFERDGALSFGYVSSDGEGVVDVGARTDYHTLREVIEAGTLASLPGECGDEADLALAGITFAPTITDPKKILCVGLELTVSIFIRFTGPIFLRTLQRLPRH